jgi:cytochrome bd-type quinol oxidase subunit 1
MSENPLEQSWLWRRIATFGVIVAAHALIAYAVWWLKDPASLKWVALALVAESVVAFTAYIMGATVTEWAKIASAVSPGLKITPMGARTETPPPTTDPKVAPE